MKIGITIPFANDNYSGGLTVQCRMWCDGLRSLGNECYLLNPWDKFDYNTFDYIMIVGLGKILIDYVSLFEQYDKPKLISAPVLDPNTTPLWKFKIYAKYCGSLRFKINKSYHDYYMCRNSFSLFLARSEFEREYIIKGLNIEPSKVKIVPISMRFDKDTIVPSFNKEDVCLHVSRLADPGKNVERLIKAAKKYKFQLNLVGTIHGKKEEIWLNSLIDGCKNIKYLGWLSEKELKEQYYKSKVLALPSIIEGVGMVALEAAVYGCEICLTNLGGPKEYYNGRAVLVDPYDVDSIGKGVLEAMTCKNAQPELSEYISKEYSVKNCMRKLDTYLKSI